MATLPVQTLSEVGAAVSYTAAAVAGDKFTLSGQESVFVKNGSAGTITVTVVARSKCSHGVLHDVLVSVPATSERSFAVQNIQRFIDIQGFCTLTYSGVTSLTVAVIRGQ